MALLLNAFNVYDRLPIINMTDKEGSRLILHRLKVGRGNFKPLNVLVLFVVNVNVLFGSQKIVFAF